MAITSAERSELMQLAVGFFNVAPGVENMSLLVTAYEDLRNGGASQSAALNAIAMALDNLQEFQQLYPVIQTSDEFAARWLGTLGLQNNAIATSFVVGQLNSGADKGAVMKAGLDALAAYSGSDAELLAAQALLANKVAAATYHTVTLEGPSTSIPSLQATLSMVTSDPASVAAQNAANDVLVGGEQPVVPVFNLTTETAAGANVMRLTGDMSVRIDFTNPNNQIRGLDLNGDGVIARDGVENALNVYPASGFAIVDAYRRDTLNDGNREQNFLGNIAFDGTGFDGDGTSTDGNIFLGGLGADSALGGIGNDFMTGGGVANGGTDYLSGGRNADFFFGEWSWLDRVDGDNLIIEGGMTSDDSAVGNNTPQDSDWLLFEASDDEDGIVIDLSDESNQWVAWIGSSGWNNWNWDYDDYYYWWMSEIEHVDASGNLYGFLNDIDVTLGGRTDSHTVGTENYGIGSSSQLLIIGSAANNILIGGFDNDRIYGDDGYYYNDGTYYYGSSSDDLLMGGNLNYLNNPNLLNIVNNGRDELYGGWGNDHIVYEADGGIIAGEWGATGYWDYDSDTLWLTREALGTGTADAMTSDGVLRFDLLADGQTRGYGGADSGWYSSSESWTQDQTNYTGSFRVTMTGMENVIATGLGAVDYKAAGSNDPDLLFNNQQNHYAYHGDLDLRGTWGKNVLYASSGDDTIEGREGNDSLSGGNGNDDFLFSLGSYYYNWGDGVDVIHRQVDADGDNIWDGTFGQDFGLDSTTTLGASQLIVDFGTTDLTSPNVAVTSFSLKIGGVVFSVDQAALAGVNSISELVAVVNAHYSAQDPAVSVTAFGSNALQVIDSGSRDISDTVPEGYLVGIALGNASAQTFATFNEAAVTVTQDRLLYVSYEDRLDNELVDDDAFTGSTISLGPDNYAQDLVYHFGADGTRIAEDQEYQIDFTNLTTQDIVTITINGVVYRLQVGIDLDNNSIGNEDSSTGTSQSDIQNNFLARYAAFINSFMDDDTAAGSVGAYHSGDSIWVWQNAYVGEETVFMTTPVVDVDDNSSGGARAAAKVTNVSSHEVHLLDFDGRNNNLNHENVLFLGNSGISRAVFATASDAGGLLSGSEAILVDGGANTLAGIPNNTATNVFLATDFSVHGDDLLIGGDGVDTILGGTGDDRIVGSRGNDTLDGGKDYYAVRVLGEPEARVYTLNDWEAASVANLKIAVPALAGLTISSIMLIDQSENGTSTISGRFSDTLLYQQADFNAGQTRFTVTLDDYVVTGGVVELRNGGAGTVGVDLTGDGTMEWTSRFTNFENIRTVSGTGNAVAGSGQGNDTLNVSAMSTSTGGVSYNLTNDGGAGEVRYSSDAHGDTTRPAQGDFESLVIRVDGVESVIGGNGNDLLLIDETEAAKNNLFAGGLGADRIEYGNSFAGDVDGVAEPTVTIRVNAAPDTDTVTMTGGRVGTTVATDTLTGVEFVTLSNNTAEGSRENDVIDVTAMTAGAVVDYTNGQIRDLAGNVQLTIEGIARMENVWADGNDTVIVADSDGMSALNARSDTMSRDISFATFLDYDELDGMARVPFVNQTSAQISNVRNEFQYKFDLSRTGGGNDTDTVDYSNATDAIAVVVELDPSRPNQHVLVDADGGTFDSAIGNVNDRVDLLIDVERVVASQGESILDLTSSTKDLEIKFGAFDITQRVAALDRDVYTVQVSDLATQVPLVRGYLEYRDAGLFDVAPNAINQPTATWNRIEGGDAGEVVILNSAHSVDNDTFNLRGGANQVKYNELTRSINLTLDVTEFDPANPLGTGLVQGEVTFQDGSGNPLPGGGTHMISSYTAGNGIASGALRVAASQDAEDSVSFATGTNKVFLLGVIGTSDNLIEVTVGAEDVNSIILTGFEFLQDASTDDVYDFANLTNVLGNLTLVDNATDDNDTIRVANDAVNFQGSGANTINLQVLNNAFAFDFDTLDITNVTANNLTIVGDTDLTALPYPTVLAAPEVPNNATTLGVLGSTPVLIDLEVVGDDDWYRVILDAGTTYRFDLEGTATGMGTNPDPYLYLYDTDGVTLLAQNDDGGIGFNSLITFTPGVSGIYYLSARAFADAFSGTSALTASIVGGRDVVGDGGDPETLIIGNQAQITGIQLFDTLALSNATTGTSFDFDIDALQLQSTGGTFSFDTFMQTLDASRITDGRSLTITVTDTFAAGKTVVGSTGNDTITGGAGDDVLEGGKGNDTLDGGIAQEVRQIQLAGILANDASGSTVDINFNGFTLSITEGVEIVEGAGSVAVGTALAAAVNANLAAINAGAAWSNGATLISAAFDGIQLLTFRFNVGTDVLNGETISVATGAAGTLLASAETVVADGGNGGSDTFVFANTAANNGVDSIVNFDQGASGDVLNFSAFLGAAANYGGFADFAAGLNLSGAANVGVVYNKAGASLSASDIQATAAAGKIAVENNSKAVVLVSADVDGVGDAANQSYSVYYVQDTNPAAAVSYAVTLVGTVSAAVEMDAAGFVSGNFA